MSEVALQVESLVVRLRVPTGEEVQAVRGVSFELRRGETLAVVGESGSGKSSLALAVTGLAPAGCSASFEGFVRLGGHETLTADEDTLRELRGDEISFVFQNAEQALNPTQRIGAQLVQMIRAHRSTGKEEARRRAVELLERVHLPDPKVVARRYPHELSGGMRQRAVIALALANEPAVLVADEPTSALDVLVQDRLLALLEELRESTRMSMLFITHDIGVAGRLADRVMVMYQGRVVEIGPTAQVLGSPTHVYTRGLLAAAPDPTRAYAPDERLQTFSADALDVRDERVHEPLGGVG